MADDQECLNFLQWDEARVQEWFSTQGYEQYAQLILGKPLNIAYKTVSSQLIPLRWCRV